MYKLVLSTAVLFFLFILWIIYSADTAQHNIFIELVRAMPYGDKIGHFAIFGFLTLGINVGLKFKGFNFFGRKLYFGTLAVAVFAFVEECSQYYFPSRNLDLVDLLADTIGIAVFTGISYCLDRIISNR